MKEDIEVGTSFTYLLPWNAPALMGMSGTSASRPDTLTALVGFEWPIPHLTPTEEISKPELERIHLDRYFTDYLFATGTPPFLNPTQTEPGADPPDFTVSTSKGQEGVDCVQLTLNSRRSVNGTFQVIRKAILQEPRHRFAHLAGHVVYMWFVTEQNDPRKPPRPSNRAQIAAVIDALANYRMDPNAFMYQPEHPDEGMPERLDNVAFDRSSPGTMFYALPMQGAAPSSMLFLRTGFEIGMAYSTSDNADAIWQELLRVVRDHDQDTTDHLLITVGGPNKEGFIFPSESYLIDVALSAAEPLRELRHLSRVSLHFWENGRIVELYPTLASGPVIYPGKFSPPYFSATITSVQPQGSSFLSADFSPS